MTETMHSKIQQSEDIGNISGVDQFEEYETLPNQEVFKDNEEPGSKNPDTSDEVIERLHRQFAELIVWVTEHSRQQGLFFRFEIALIPMVFALGRSLIQLFFVLHEEQLLKQLPDRKCIRGKWYTAQNPKRRQLGTFFGKLYFWRRYYSKDEGGAGFHPLDKKVGLTTDGFSLYVMSLACRLATQMPYAAASNLMSLFVGNGPSHTMMEQMVLGLGYYARDYMEQALAPLGDGEWLVIQIDLKCAPTAKKKELRKRRGKRKKKNPHPKSARHRGRHKRRRSGPKKRRKKGDKSKNGRAVTLVVMYTLKKSPDGKLLGPINKKVYGSFAGKRYGFAWARAMANKRGFTPESGKRIQFVSDGDPDFRIYLKDYFGDYSKKQFIQTLDLPHVMEYVWKAGRALHREGSDELSDWAQKQKNNFLLSRADLVVEELEIILAKVPKTGPGNKTKRKHLTDAIKYIKNNLDRMDYKYLRDQDLELASGAVEGAVNYVVGYRFDHGGMRWIVERAEMLLQLRCIQLNGEWDDFMAWLEQNLETRINRSISPPRLCRQKPVPLPEVTEIGLAS